MPSDVVDLGSATHGKDISDGQGVFGIAEDVAVLCCGAPHFASLTASPL